VTPKQAWPQASHQLNPALLTRMLIPVQLYIFINHIGTVFRIWIWYPLPNRTVDFFYLCSPPRRQWLIVHENDCITVHCMINYEDLYFHVIRYYNLMFFRRNSHFWGQMISSPPGKTWPGPPLNPALDRIRVSKDIQDPTLAVIWLLYCTYGLGCNRRTRNPRWWRILIPRWWRIGVQWWFKMRRQQLPSQKSKP